IAVLGRCPDHGARAVRGLRTCTLRLACWGRCGAHGRRVDEPPRRGPWPLSAPPAHEHFRRSRMSRSVIVGFLLTLASAFFFAVSGPIAKTMYAIGWTPGSVVLIRFAGSAFLLLIPTLIALRGRWDEVLRH